MLITPAGLACMFTTSVESACMHGQVHGHRQASHQPGMISWMHRWPGIQKIYALSWFCVDGTGLWHAATPRFPSAGSRVGDQPERPVALLPSHLRCPVDNLLNRWHWSAEHQSKARLPVHARQDQRCIASRHA
eukprot:365981-Chlamydomonas_euryale.AAC.4